MAEIKTKRNGRRLKKQGDFQIRNVPIVRAAQQTRASQARETTLLPRGYDQPILFAIARDQHTVFVSWNIDWRRVFRTEAPAHRQVYLRVIDSDGREQRRVAVEPMVAMHYLTMSGEYDRHFLEIGYFKPSHTWHSVAISDQVRLPRHQSGENAAVDLATIPFHLKFQKILDLFGPTNATSLARAVSMVQTRLCNERTPNELSLAEKGILQELDVPLPQIAKAHSDFKNSGSERLARHAALLRCRAATRGRGFVGYAGS